MSVLDHRLIDFLRLHASGCFVMPNPWDVGSARALEQMGFQAVATTSAGLAWSLGLADTEITLEQALGHFRAIVNAVDLPVNADFEGGYAVEPGAVAENVKRAVDTGVCGISIEDASGSVSEPLLPFDVSVARIAASARAIDESGTGALLTARSEGFVVGRPDIDETVRRLTAYAEAGADCLYAPRISAVEHVTAVVEAVAPKPVNLLVNEPFITVAGAARLGVRRVSVGGTLARSSWKGFLDAAREISEDGTFTAFRDLPDVDALMGP